MDRRRFLTALAAGVAVAVSGLPDSAASAQPNVLPGLPLPPEMPLPSLPPLPPLPIPGLAPPLVPHKFPIPAGPISALPGKGNYLALTVDDGANTNVVGAYIKFAQDTGARFTFFVTGAYRSWLDHRNTLAPLVESGQIQLGNHTWNHPRLTSLSGNEIADQLNRTKTFLRNTYGVDGTPFYRPPYGRRNAFVDKVAADLGYTASTMWYGTLGDDQIISEKAIIDNARRYFRAQAVVIGHLNHPAVMHTYPQLTEIIRERKLTMVTLNDYFQTR